MKTVIITGGSGLIGKGLTVHLLKKGYNVVITSKTSDKIDFLSQKFLNQYKDHLDIFKLDYFDISSVYRFVKNLERKKIYPDSIIHNARSLESLKIEKNGQSLPQNFIAEFQMGIVGPYQLNNLIIESKIGVQLKNIIFVSSIYGVVGPNPALYDNFEHQSPIQYGTTKAAQIHLTKELAIRLSKKGIRVNAISAGGIKGRSDKSFEKKYSRLNPQNKMLSVENIIKPIEFLIKNDSEAITGHNLIVDGGWTVW